MSLRRMVRSMKRTKCRTYFYSQWAWLTGAQRGNIVAAGRYRRACLLSFVPTSSFPLSNEGWLPRQGRVTCPLSWKRGGDSRGWPQTERISEKGFSASFWGTRLSSWWHFCQGRGSTGTHALPQRTDRWVTLVYKNLPVLDVHSCCNF